MGGARAQEWMRYVDARKFVAGAFVWTGFDYGGEAQLHFWPGVVSHFGILDYCGFPERCILVLQGLVDGRTGVACASSLEWNRYGFGRCTSVYQYG